ncbi:uncharacterized protein K452DRAFT_296660 [Aplosporella prunicola CBS 121167]|uniref:Guanine nucleotide-exchange factor SEC12 n=1 Tax=Aplosporella prunicola CBS 121167 TaxID=1176127 RepID=A0A6A6BHN8_9PEZI|nr:uncharacterized protein K452DRAFT_296660 [Aplosporella prunicola CBS 121167]KAF2143660.1 hypothetical protein K452DRAFT_296660 [Aplosporella prunicola CBS 121167]
MSPNTSFTKATLSYPVYAADFDPYNRGYLLVGGGGGEGRSGVPNKISLLDVSSRSTLDTVAEADLTSQEDAVMTLANLASKDGLITFSGINSSEKERVADNNQHLRAFQVAYPKKKSQGSKKSEKQSKGNISFLSKTSLFTSPKNEIVKKDNYQRLLRLSPAQKRDGGHKRIGAIATGLNPESELVVFNATSNAPSEADVIYRIHPKEGADVNDVDIYEPSEGHFNVAYCTDRQVFIYDIAYDFRNKRATSVTSSNEFVPAYTLPFPDVFKGGPRPTIKYLRWLTPTHLLLCCNLPQRKGAELLVLHTHPTGPGEVILKKKLPTRIKAAGGMDVCSLDADPETGARQVVVAIAGHDIAIHVWTLDYSGPKTDTISRFRSCTTLQDVHPLQMTKVVFSPFYSPWPPKSKNGSAPKRPGPQYLQLASTSLGNTVVVDTFSLTPVAPKKPYSRYVLSTQKSALVNTGVPLFVAGFALLVTLMLLQSYLDLQSGGVGESNIQLLPQGLRDAFAKMQPKLPPGAREPVVQDEQATSSVIVEEPTASSMIVDEQTATSAIVDAMPDIDAIVSEVPGA